MRYTKSALAALTCALVIVPVSIASAAEESSSDRPSAESSGSTAPSEEGNPNSQRARAAEVCTDAEQFGETGYITRNGETIGSVKQFYSAECDENYSYLWVWESFRDQVSAYDVHISLYSYMTDAHAVEQSWIHTHEQEFWSEGIAWRGEYSSAVGAVRAVGDPLPSEAYSEQVCVDDELAEG